MKDVLQNLESLDIPGLMDASQIAYATFRSSFPGAALHDEPGLLWFETGVPLKIFNGVLRTQLEVDALPATIERMVTHFRRRQLPFEWNVGPTSQPYDFDDLLRPYALSRAEDEIGMAMDLHMLNENMPPIPNLVIQEVTTDEQLRQWSQTWGRGAPPEASTHWYTLYSGLKLTAASPVHLYLGMLDGEPVATAALFFELGVAAIHHIMTAHKVRRMGIGAAITLHMAQEARRLGFRIAILTATLLGINIYRRLGFREYCSFKTYE